MTYIPYLGTFFFSRYTPVWPWPVIILTGLNKCVLYSHRAAQKMCPILTGLFICVLFSQGSKSVLFSLG